MRRWLRIFLENVAIGVGILLFFLTLSDRFSFSHNIFRSWFLLPQVLSDVPPHPPKSIPFLFLWNVIFKRMILSLLTFFHIFVKSSSATGTSVDFPVSCSSLLTAFYQCHALHQSYVKMTLHVMMWKVLNLLLSQ